MQSTGHPYDSAPFASTMSSTAHLPYARAAPQSHYRHGVSESERHLSPTAVNQYRTSSHSPQPTPTGGPPPHYQQHTTALRERSETPSGGAGAPPQYHVRSAAAGYESQPHSRYAQNGHVSDTASSEHHPHSASVYHSSHHQAHHAAPHSNGHMPPSIVSHSHYPKPNASPHPPYGFHSNGTRNSYSQHYGAPSASIHQSPPSYSALPSHADHHVSRAPSYEYPSRVGAYSAHLEYPRQMEHHPAYHYGGYYGTREPEYAREHVHHTTSSWIHPSDSTHAKPNSYANAVDPTGRYMHHESIHTGPHPYTVQNSSYQPPPASADASIPPLPVPPIAHVHHGYGYTHHGMPISTVNMIHAEQQNDKVAGNKTKNPLIALPRRAKSPAAKKQKKLRNLTALPPVNNGSLKVEHNGLHSETSPVSGTSPPSAGSGRRSKKGRKRKRSASKPESQDSDENFEMRTTRATKRQKTLANKKMNANKGPAAKARKKKKSAKRRSELSIFDNYIEYPAPEARVKPTDIEEGSNFIFSNATFDMFVDACVSYSDSLQWLQDTFVERSTESARRRYDDEIVPSHADIKKACRFMERNLRHCLNEKERLLRAPREARGSWYPKGISPNDRQIFEDIKTGRGTDVFEMLCMTDMLKISEEDIAKEIASNRVSDALPPMEDDSSLLSRVRVTTYLGASKNVKTKRVDASSYKLDTSEIESDLQLFGVGPLRPRKSKKRGRVPPTLSALRKEQFEKISVETEEKDDEKQEMKQEPQNESTMEDVEEEEEQADEYVPPEANLDNGTPTFEGRSLRSTRTTRASSDNSSPQPAPEKDSSEPLYGDTDYAPPKSLVAPVKNLRRRLRQSSTRELHKDVNQDETISMKA